MTQGEKIDKILGELGDVKINVALILQHEANVDTHLATLNSKVATHAAKHNKLDVLIARHGVWIGIVSTVITAVLVAYATGKL